MKEEIGPPGNLPGRPEVSSESAWLPIDSAPRDGTRVHLLYPDDIGVFDFANWRDDLGWSRPYLTTDGDLFYSTFPNVEPTHWRPIPPPGAC